MLMYRKLKMVFIFYLYLNWPLAATSYTKSSYLDLLYSHKKFHPIPRVTVHDVPFFYVSTDLKGEESNESEAENTDDDDGDASDDDDDEKDSSDSYADILSEDNEEEEATEHVKISKTSIETKMSSDVKTVNLKDIPLVFTIPETYKDFEKLLSKYGINCNCKVVSSAEVYDTIVTRMMKYNKASSPSSLPRLFHFIIQFILDTCEQAGCLSPFVKKLCSTSIPILHSLLVNNCAMCVSTLENGENFDDLFHLQSLPIHKLLFFEISSKLFSAPEFRRRLLTKVNEKLVEILNKTKVKNLPTLMKILFILKIIFQMTVEAKRYCPEVVSTLDSLLLCFTGTSEAWTSFAVPAIRPMKKLLFISSSECEQSTPVNKALGKFLTENVDISPEITVETKLGILSATISLVKKFVPVYEKLPSAKEIFSVTTSTIQTLINLRDWPCSITKGLNEALEVLCSLSKPKKSIPIPATPSRPKPLKLYEPLIDDNLDFTRKKKHGKNSETSRLQQRVKQEMKSAVREIRKDASFLAQQQLKEQLKKDEERKRKVKQLLGALATQEGEYKKSKRAK